MSLLYFHNAATTNFKKLRYYKISIALLTSGNHNDKRMHAEKNVRHVFLLRQEQRVLFNLWIGQLLSYVLYMFAWKIPTKFPWCHCIDLREGNGHSLCHASINNVCVTVDGFFEARQIMYSCVTCSFIYVILLSFPLLRWHFKLTFLIRNFFYPSTHNNIIQWNIILALTKTTKSMNCAVSNYKLMCGTRRLLVAIGTIPVLLSMFLWH